jgi:hypothetical protein
VVQVVAAQIETVDEGQRRGPRCTSGPCSGPAAEWRISCMPGDSPV